MPVRNEGLRLLSSEEIALTSGKTYIRQIRAKTAKAIDENTTVEYYSLSDRAKIAWNATMTVLGLFNHATKKETVKQIETAVTETKQKIDSLKTIELLKKPY
jgi:hypothetical protein